MSIAIKQNKYVFLAIFSFIFIVLAGKAHAQTVFLSPSATTTTPNQDITIDVKLDQVSNLFGAPFHLRFDPGVLQFINAADGGLLSNNGVDSLDFATSTNPAGRLILGINRQTVNGVSTTSTSTIVHLYFHTLDVVATTTTLHFEANFLMDPALVEIASTWQDGSVTVADTEAPTVPGSFTASATSMTQLDLSWASSTDNVGVAAYYLYRGSTSTLIATTTGLSFSDTGRAASTTYNYFIKAVDAAGNSSGFATTSGTTLGDSTSPSITILTPTSSATYNSSSTPISLTGTSTDNVAVTSVTWSRVNGATATGTASGTASWTASGITLLSGSNVISIVAHDAAGNTATDTLTITFDNTAPAVAITSPTASATTSASSTSFTLAGTASDANSVSSVAWTNSQGGSGTTTGTSSWSVAGSLLNLQTGSNLVTVTARDSFGNTATDTLTITFDNTAPTVSISIPTTGATYFASSTPVNLSGTASDNVAVTAVVLTGGSGTTTGTSSWSITGIALSSATTTLTVTVRDSLSNTATDSLIIYLDTVLPLIPTSTPGSASAASASQINLSWPAGSDTGNSGLAGYKIYRNSTSTAPVATVASTTTSYNDTGLSASTAYSYYIFAYDNAGNQSTSYATSSATTSAAPVTPPSGGGGGGSFTPPDTTPPARPANFRATPADSRITLTWVNPTDSDFGGVLILRTEATSTPVCPTAHNDLKAKEVFRGKAIERIDIGLNNSLKYCYAIFSFDNIPNYTSPSVLTAQPGAGQSTTVATSTTETVINNQTGTTSGSISLADAPGSVVDAVSSDEAHQTFDRNQFVEMTAVTKGIYDKIMSHASSAGSGRAAGYNDQEKRALAYFIQNGTANTRILGAGERGGSVGSFIAAFGRLPGSIADWQDVIKIGNGRWPKQINLKAEAAAEIVFKKIYLHTPKRTTNKYDDNAIRIIAYGLRPAKRNMASEAAAIKSFKYIFKRAPSKSNDWDIVRAIAYSGAKR
jgi:chitodextrinase